MGLISDVQMEVTSWYMSASMPHEQGLHDHDPDDDKQGLGTVSLMFFL